MNSENTNLHRWPRLKERRRELRQSSTSAEEHLWKYLRNRQLGGYKFRRQHSIGPYIVDFYCQELNLAIEVDGSIHSKPHIKNYDKKRQRDLETLGIRFLRFTNTDVLKDIHSTLDTILVLAPLPRP